MGITIALAGDTMLGRLVAEQLGRVSPSDLFSPEIAAVAAEADAFVLNLECCISDRGEPWPAPGKPFFFRAPPVAVDVLAQLGVDCVTLANNHALDYGFTALSDTFEHLDGAAISHVGAGRDVNEARAARTLDISGFRLAVVGFTDHPRDFAAGPDRPGTAFADLQTGIPTWVLGTIAAAATTADAVLVTPHWGPNMVAEPVAHVRRAATALLDAGATLVAGHSAHVFHGVEGPVLWDLGDFIDDYRVDPVLRNDLGLLWLVSLDERGPTRLEAVPLHLELAHTRLAPAEERPWIHARFAAACRAMGTEVHAEGDRIVVTFAPAAPGS